MRLPTLIVIALLSGSAAWAADALESLDADFLSYLAEVEGDDDDWTIVEDTAARPQASAEKAAAKPTSPSDSSATEVPAKTHAPDAGNQ